MSAEPLEVVTLVRRYEDATTHLPPFTFNDEFDRTPYVSTRIRIEIDTRASSSQYITPAAMNALVSLELPLQDWYLVNVLYRVKGLMGHGNYCVWYLHRNHVVGIEPMHYRCSNCRLAFIAHERGKCLYDTTRFSWQKLDSHCRNHAQQHEKAMDLRTQQVRPLIDWMEEVCQIFT